MKKKASKRGKKASENKLEHELYDVVPAPLGKRTSKKNTEEDIVKKLITARAVFLMRLYSRLCVSSHVFHLPPRQAAKFVLEADFELENSVFIAAMEELNLDDVIEESNLDKFEHPSRLGCPEESPQGGRS